MIVRRAEERDLDAMLDLYEAVAAEGRYIGGEAPVDREARRLRWLEHFEDPDHVSFVAEAGGRIVGQGALTGTGVAELGMLVASDWRGHGVGTALMQACLDWARRSGAHKIALQVWPHNEAARNLYRKFGFEEEGYLRRHWRRRNGELWDSVIMGLLIPENEAATSSNVAQCGD
ncbi:MAG: GNAT family N-acetyltransferase [Actinobacteria bacterium]|nr:GNAT family N-acetyltransferase [Actinomycetota bacterium]